MLKMLTKMARRVYLSEGGKGRKYDVPTVLCIAIGLALAVCTTALHIFLCQILLLINVTKLCYKLYSGFADTDPTCRTGLTNAG